MSHIQALRGTKDIFFPEISLWQVIEDISSQILDLANYREIRTPIFENSNLYIRSLGQVTDVVQKEMYNFQDRGERELTLRPEGTAGVARAFIEQKLYNKSFPQRFWYSGPMFRYERPQAGRQRQFHQLGIECLGSIDPRIDVEIMCLALDILKKLQISNLRLEINSLGNVETRTVYKQELYNYLFQYKSDLDIDSQNRLETNPLRLLDSKDSKIKLLLEQAPSILDYLDDFSKKHFNLVCYYLDSLSIEYIINSNLVRGLDYYNNTTFEIKSLTLGAQDTLCGGGRYDNLIESLGGPSTPAVGWGMGIERLLLLISRDNFNITKNIDCYLITIGNNAKKQSLEILYKLRNIGLKVDICLSDASLSKQIKKANQLNAMTCVILGEDEIRNNSIILKWLNIREQEIIELSNISLIAKKIKTHKETQVV
uniref:histidine-tRNA synthetase n=1 Tax=Goniotrichopsis reniformis TaxID=468933 RepID=UPI001FCDCE63|nr:histidine-tRNA synthetase [Goniotrichopsis reniformis]UNJ14863.1 histidine-tRNA synthetase [Goniotrichopsis reniformis]